MKKLFSLLLVVAAMVLTLAACGVTNADSNAADEPKNNAAADAANPAPAEETPESTGNKVLVAYFSANGQTAKLAKAIAGVTGGDLFEIAPETAYTAADLDRMDKKSRSTIEMNAPKSRPAIAGQVADMVQYDTVFVGFPIWWGQAPKIVYTFLESYDLSGKTIVPFCTSGGSGMGGEDILKAACSKDTKWLPGKRLSSRESAASVQKWVESLGL